MGRDAEEGGSSNCDGLVRPLKEVASCDGGGDAGIQVEMKTIDLRSPESIPAWRQGAVETQDVEVCMVLEVRSGMKD